MWRGWTGMEVPQQIGQRRARTSCHTWVKMSPQVDSTTYHDLRLGLAVPHEVLTALRRCGPHRRRHRGLVPRHRDGPRDRTADQRQRRLRAPRRPGEGAEGWPQNSYTSSGPTRAVRPRASRPSRIPHARPTSPARIRLRLLLRDSVQAARPVVVRHEYRLPQCVTPTSRRPPAPKILGPAKPPTAMSAARSSGKASAGATATRSPVVRREMDRR